MEEEENVRPTDDRVEHCEVFLASAKMQSIQSMGIHDTVKGLLDATPISHHWWLIFKFPGGIIYHHELNTKSKENKNFITHKCIAGKYRDDYDYFSLGVYDLSPKGVSDVFVSHPMLMTEYTPTENNCQKFVIIALENLDIDPSLIPYPTVSQAIKAVSAAVSAGVKKISN